MGDVRLAGYASVFGVPDSGGDVVLPGAFAGAAGRVPLLWRLDISPPGPHFGGWPIAVLFDHGREPWDAQMICS